MPALRWTSFALAGIFAATLAVPAAAQDVDPRPTAPEPKAKVKLDKYRLTAEEIAARADVSTAYDAVKALRPHFLKETRLSGKIGSGYRIGESVGPETGIQRPSPGGGGGSGSTGGTGGSGGTSGGTSGGSGGTGGAANPPRASGAGAGGALGARGESGESSFANNPSGKVTAVLYVDEMKQYTLDELKNIRAADIAEIKLITPAEALARYGTGHEGGAILLKTTRVRP